MWSKFYGVLLQGKVFYHTATNEGISSRILIKKLFLERNRRNECVKTQNVFSSTAGNEKRVHCMWILYTKFKYFY